MKTKQRVILGIVSLAVVVLLFLLLRGRNGDDGGILSRRPTLSRPVGEPPGPSQISSVAPTPSKPPDVLERARAVAVVASSRMVEERAVEFGNLVRSIWSAELGTVFAAADNRDDVKVPDGMKVASVAEALGRCAMCLLLWDEDMQRSVAKELKDYCETGGWLVFVSCPWIGSPPKSSPTELLRYRGLGGMADLGASVVARDRRAVAMLRHPSIPDLPVREALRVYLRSGKALGGGDGRAIPLVRFEEPALRGVNIQAVAHGGIVEVNWDCPAGGRIGEAESEEFIKTILAWLAEKETWREPVEQAGVPLKIVARTPTGEPAPGAEIAVRLHTDWARSVSQEIVTVGENGEGEVPTKAPAIYTAWAAGEGYSSDTLALARVEEGTAPEPLVVTVRPSLRIAGTAVYTGEATGPAGGVPVDLLPSSRARGTDVASTETDDEGRFGFEGVPGGRPYLLRCETEEWAGLEEIDLPESTDSGAFEVTLGLKKLVAIDGRVVEEGEEQKPIEGATVRVEPYWGVKALPLFLQHLRGKTALTGDEGEFRLPVLPGVTHQIRAEAPGYVWRERDVDERRDRMRGGWQEVKAPATVTLELCAGTVVKGIVYFPGGQPAPEAEVRLKRYANSIVMQDSVQVADGDGRFYFWCVASSQRSYQEKTKSITLTGKWEGLAGITIGSFPLHQKQIEVVLSLREPRCVRIRGMVTDMQEHPVANAALYSNWRRDYGAIGHSDEEGFLEVQLTTEGYVGEQAFPHDLALYVWKEGYESVPVDRGELEAAARDNQLIRVALPRSNGWIAGRVLLDDGTPLRNETVDLEAWNKEAIGSLSLRTRRRVILGDGGEFRLEMIRIEARGPEVFEEPVKAVDLKVDWHADPACHDLRVTAFKRDIRLGTSDVVVRLGPIGVFRGRFVSAENGAPLSDVSVFIIREGILREFKTGVLGEFRFPWILTGEYGLKAVCRGFFPDQRTIMSDGRAKNLGDIVLHKSLTVTGQAVYKESGLAVIGAEVRIGAIMRNWGKHPSVAVADCAQGTTDSTGGFSLRIYNPFDVSQNDPMTSHTMSLRVEKGTTRKNLDFDPSRAGAIGIVNLGRIELDTPEER